MRRIDECVYEAIGLSGAFFTEEFLRQRIAEVLEEVSEEIKKYEMPVLFEKYLTIFEPETILNGITLIDCNFLTTHKHDKWFIGFPILGMPQPMSRKRYNIDTHKLLQDLNFLSDDADPSAVRFIIDVLTIHNT